MAARERVTGGAGNRSGVPDNLVAYTSDQAHSSIQKAARIAGIDGRMMFIDTAPSAARITSVVNVGGVVRSRNRGSGRGVMSPQIGLTGAPVQRFR